MRKRPGVTGSVCVVPQGAKVIKSSGARID